MDAKTKYTKLCVDLLSAASAARPLGSTEDGGTCNLDSLELYLPGWNKDRVIDAIHASGLGGFETTSFRTRVFVVIPPVSAQGNARTRQAEKMCEVMKALGYNATVWYQMD